MTSIAAGASALFQGGQSIISSTAVNKKLVQFIVSSTQQSLCVFDLSKQEAYKHSAKATRLPAEGFDLTDHVIFEPVSLQLEVYVSDTPLNQTDDDAGTLANPTAYARELLQEGAVTAISALAGPLGVVAATTGYALYNSQQSTRTARSTAAYNTLRKAYDNRTLLDVRTKLGIYRHMLIEDLSTTRDGKAGDELTFSVSMLQIQIHSAQIVDASSLKQAALAAGYADQGTQSDKATDQFGNPLGDGRAQEKSDVSAANKALGGFLSGFGG